MGTPSLVSPLKRLFHGSTPPEDAPYECHACGARFEVQYHVCPACGGYRIERADWSPS